MNFSSIQFSGASRRWRAQTCLSVLLGCVLGMSSGVRAQDDKSLIDSCHYADDAAAQAAWQPMAGTSPATVATIDGVKALRLRCAFAGRPIERASWDHRLHLDLSSCRGLQFRFHCRDTAPVSYFSLYLQSGNGWYATTFYPETSGWNTITIDKASLGIEGTPAGWSAIWTIRVSAWRGGDADTKFALRDLRKVGQLGRDTLVALLRCDSAARQRPDEVRSIEQFTATVALALERAGVGYATLSDVNLAPETLRRAKLVILPYNPTMPERTADELVSYLRTRGRLITFYGMPARLRPVVKIDSAGYVRPKNPGTFTAMRFVADAVPGAPAVVGQKSWNINEPRAVPGSSRVVAEWLDESGQATGHAAIVVSSTGVEVSHVLLGDDPAHKSRMLLALAGSLVPEIWQRAIDQRLASLGRIAEYRDFDDASARIEQSSQREPRVLAALAEARAQREAAIKLRTSSQYANAVRCADVAAERLRDAYCLAQRPLPGEFRAAWCHSAFGVEGQSWDAAIRDLAANGFTAILPNMLWGGVAYYESQVLPVAPEVASRGDQISQCVTACKKYGVQVHVWKVNWNLGRAPKYFVDRLRHEGRLQASAQGKEELWLCPSHPKNQQLEIDAMVEVARRYDVDGIHFDYIRYPDGDHCFCDGCKTRFQAVLGTPLGRWPQDVLAGGPHRQAWLDWRRDNITKVVKAVSEQVRAIKPKVKLSAAVFRNWPTDRDAVGQDWKLWCERGYLDFVCPMDYTASAAQFETWVSHQREWAGQTPCYPGIGAYVLTPEQVIGQIQATRRHEMRGFTVFNYDAQMAQTLLPRLGDGITRRSGPGSKPQ